MINTLKVSLFSIWLCKKTLKALAPIALNSALYLFYIVKQSSRMFCQILPVGTECAHLAPLAY